MKFDGEKLKVLRGARKWDQHRLAEAARKQGVGITQSQISRYENGQEPSGRNALALATALDVDVRELYGDDTDDEEAAPMPSLLTIAAALQAEVERLVDARLAKRQEAAA